MPLRRLFVLGVTGLLVGCGAHVRSVVDPVSYSRPVDEFKGIDAPSVTLTVDPATRSEPQLEPVFEAPLDRIEAYESLELRASNGFAETRSEPAGIDDLLAFGSAERPIVPAPATAELVATDLVRTPHDLPIQINDKVLSYLELFQRDLRSFIGEGLARGARYLPMIQDVFHAEGLPLDLAYVPLIESAFKPTALSRAQAKGLWQFQAGTAREVGLRQNWFLDERSDPEKATRAAAQYLKTLRGLFDGDWNLALAAYNAGMGRVQRAMKQAHKTDYWALTASARYLPRETREYVPMILAAILIARNPVQYGFEIGLVEPLDYDTVNVPDALPLDTVAEWLDVPVDEVQALNPELRRRMTPIGQHKLKVPLGSASIVERQLAFAPSSMFASAAFRFHTVKRGESLLGIARTHKTTRAKLAAANDLRTTSRLRTGATLMVPIAPSAAFASRVSRAKTPAVISAASGGAATYRVKRGDTLSRIASQFDTSVERLKSLNQLSSDAIAVGDKLTVRR